jgi:hypothetical protein
MSTKLSYYQTILCPQITSQNFKIKISSARAWSHSTKDHFHDEWGYMTVDPNGNVTLMTAGNNGN